ncbi:uncharacterized protein LOC117336408 [Pecten maximus]|uniref:uncharacterized protein LOC117336408 n=1 Tax=Pecten maximus TaxID=6579 RepID=UPI001457F280|nr:uncharacterized protein LOC117336408 [Pecten maximus]
MAEGGEQDNRTASPEKITTTVNARSLECPICLDKLRHPKSLPCLHSFCEECLAAYISKDTENSSVNTFPCPICRAVTVPLDPTAAVHLWAKQFPTNSLLMELSDTHKEGHLCQPCKHKGDSKTPAEFWCDRMNSFFCSSCKTCHHDIIHVECNIIHVSEMTNQTKHGSPRYPRCKKHGKKTDLFCEDHSSLACSKCIAIDHRRCDEVLTAEDFCEKLNDGPKFQEMKTSLSEEILKLQTLTKHIKHHMDKFSTDRDQVLSDLTDLRQNIIAKFDQLKEALVNDLTKVYKEQKTNMEKHTQRCESMSTAMTATRQLADTESLLTDPPHTISILLRGTAEVKSCESFVKDTEASCKPVLIRYKTPGIEDVKFDFGKIKFEQVPLGPSHKTMMKPLCERHAQKITNIEVKFPSDNATCNFTGILLTTDGRIVVADQRNRKIKLVTDKGVLLDESSLSEEPYGLCWVNNTTVAITMPWANMISFLDITSTKFSLSSHPVVNTSRPCYGISYHDGEFTLTSGDNKPFEVYSVTASGQVDTLYHPKMAPRFIVCDPIKRDIVVTMSTGSPGDVAVCRLSKSKNETIAVRGILKAPRGVDLDSDGNVYVCGNGSRNVVQMSSDGSVVRELLTSSDGIEGLLSISVCADKFVLTRSCSSNFITLYQLV